MNLKLIHFKLTVILILKKSKENKSQLAKEIRSKEIITNTKGIKQLHRKYIPHKKMLLFN